MPDILILGKKRSKTKVTVMRKLSEQEMERLGNFL